MLCHSGSVVVRLSLRRSFGSAALSSNLLTQRPLHPKPLTEPVGITAACRAGKISSGSCHADKQTFHLSRCFSSSSSVDGGGGVWQSLAASTPVQLTEELLVGVQQASGLPWWLSIVCSTLALRTTITLPLAAYQMVIIAKVCASKPIS